MGPSVFFSALMRHAARFFPPGLALLVSCSAAPIETLYQHAPPTATNPAPRLSASSTLPKPSAPPPVEPPAKEIPAMPRAELPPPATLTNAGASSCTVGPAVKIGEWGERISASEYKYRSADAWSPRVRVAANAQGGLALWAENRDEFRAVALTPQGAPAGPLSSFPMPGFLLRAFQPVGEGFLLLTEDHCPDSSQECLFARWLDATGKPFVQKTIALPTSAMWESASDGQGIFLVSEASNEPTRVLRAWVDINREPQLTMTEVSVKLRHIWPDTTLTPRSGSNGGWVMIAHGPEQSYTLVTDTGLQANVRLEPQPLTLPIATSTDEGFAILWRDAPTRKVQIARMDKAGVILETKSFEPDGVAPPPFSNIIRGRADDIQGDLTGIVLDRIDLLWRHLGSTLLAKPAEFPWQGRSTPAHAAWFGDRFVAIYPAKASGGAVHFVTRSVSCAGGRAIGATHKH